MTDKKDIESTETKARLKDLERFAAIGQIATMICKDIRDPLSGIKNAAYFLKTKQYYQSDKDSNEMLLLIERSVNRANHKINELLDYSAELNEGGSPRQ
jgi:signal transduction histidine kinase